MRLSHISVCTVLLTALPVQASFPDGPGDMPKTLLPKVLLYASFDKDVHADLAKGVASVATRFDNPEVKGRFVFEKDFDRKVFRIAADKGIHGGALDAVNVLPNRGRIFFPAKSNLAYDKKGWQGAVSFWIKTNPDKLLKTTFCDPVQITHKGANNGGLWVDFNDAMPRDLRMGVFPGVPDDKKPIGESDPGAPLVRVPKIGFQATDWHHIVMTWENLDTGKPNAHARLYIDGKLAGELKKRELAMNWNMDETGIYIAVNYIGLLDEFATFGTALTSDEVLWLSRNASPFAAALGKK